MQNAKLKYKIQNTRYLITNLFSEGHAEQH